MKVLQHNLNHCEAAQDLLLQTVREQKPDLLIILEPYRRLSTQSWVPDATGKAVIWSCNNLPFQEAVDSTEKYFVRTKVGNIHFYSCYKPPSLTLDEFVEVLDKLIEDVKEHSPVAMSGDFNAWAINWGSKETNP